MPGKWVRREQAREHERRAWEMRQAGATQERIAAELGVSQQAVSRILRRVDRRVLKELHDQAMLAKLEQLARLDFIIDEAMQAWERSKEPAQVAVQKKLDSGEIVATLTTVAQCGDVAYIREARTAMADQRKLWGLAGTQRDGKVSGIIEVKLTDEERVADIKAIMHDEPHVAAVERCSA